jgi:hypothetical protein
MNFPTKRNFEEALPGTGNGERRHQQTRHRREPQFPGDPQEQAWRMRALPGQLISRIHDEAAAAHNKSKAAIAASAIA